MENENTCPVAEQVCTDEAISETEYTINPDGSVAECNPEGQPA